MTDLLPAYSQDSGNVVGLGVDGKSPLPNVLGASLEGSNLVITDNIFANNFIGSMLVEGENVLVSGTSLA